MFLAHDLQMHDCAHYRVSNPIPISTCPWKPGNPIVPCMFGVDDPDLSDQAAVKTHVSQFHPSEDIPHVFQLAPIGHQHSKQAGNPIAFKDYLWAPSSPSLTSHL